MAAVYATALPGAVAGGHAFRQLQAARTRTALAWLAIATVVIVGLTLITDLPGFLTATDRPHGYRPLGPLPHAC